jgi:hypothetical protein
MSTLPIVFKDEQQLLAFAEEFIVKDRLASLENDVNRCLPTQRAKIEVTGYAPFPALMYCFSVIDLLGSLMTGNARSGNTTDNASRYMKEYLNIPKDKVRLLQKIYRHKLVHLSQPKLAMLYDNQILAWKHDEGLPAKHLTIDPTPGDIPLPMGLGNIHCDAQYIVSISVLMNDIRDSVIRSPGGYLEDLKNNADLQNKFVAAINQIYDPVITD